MFGIRRLKERLDRLAEDVDELQSRKQRDVVVGKCECASSDSYKSEIEVANAYRSVVGWFGSSGWVEPPSAVLFLLPNGVIECKRCKRRYMLSGLTPVERRKDPKAKGGRRK